MGNGYGLGHKCKSAVKKESQGKAQTTHRRSDIATAECTLSSYAGAGFGLHRMRKMGIETKNALKFWERGSGSTRTGVTATGRDESQRVPSSETPSKKGFGASISPGILSKLFAALRGIQTYLSTPVLPHGQENLGVGGTPTIFGREFSGEFFWGPTLETQWEKNLQGLKSWAWLPKFCRTPKSAETFLQQAFYYMQNVPQNLPAEPPKVSQISGEA